MRTITLEDVRRCMSAHVPLYSWRQPRYQYVALRALQQMWNPGHVSALDVGGGTGIMAYTIKTLFGLERVASVDVQHRFLPSLGIQTVIFDGTTLPFADSSFDCILLFNVLHHVPDTSRVALLRECHRVAGRGPLYIKDHLSQGRADDARLVVLDLLGNLPFSGMVRASYLREDDWRELASRTEYESSGYLSGKYRTALMERVFPNRLEVSMRWRPVGR